MGLFPDLLNEAMHGVHISMGLGRKFKLRFLIAEDILTALPKSKQKPIPAVIAADVCFRRP